jgi:hypothetical protein
VEYVEKTETFCKLIVLTLHNPYCVVSSLFGAAGHQIFSQVDGRATASQRGAPQQPHHIIDYITSTGRIDGRTSSALEPFPPVLGHDEITPWRHCPCWWRWRRRRRHRRRRRRRPASSSTSASSSSSSRQLHTPSEHGRPRLSGRRPVLPAAAIAPPRIHGVVVVVLVVLVVLPRS